MAYKHDYDRALTRLNTIVARLNDGESLSVKELAEEFNVSPRTIQRDFNNRLVSLYPIYQDNKRWKMQDGYKIEKSTSVEDTIVLDILEKMTNDLGTKFSTKAKKLLSKIKNNDFNPIYAKLNMEDISDSLHLIAKLEDTIQKKQEISCRYNAKEIGLKPLKIANFEGFWYLIALDSKDDVVKKYHLKSLEEINISDVTFVYPKELEEALEEAVNIWFDIDKEAFEVQLFIDPYAAKVLNRKPISKTQKLLKEYKDGSIEVGIKITHDMEITSIVKYWIPHIKVIDPKWLHEKIQNDVEKFMGEKTK